MEIGSTESSTDVVSSAAETFIDSIIANQTVSNLSLRKCYSLSFRCGMKPTDDDLYKLLMLKAESRDYLMIEKGENVPLLLESH